MAYVTSEQLQLELENLAHELGISVQELLQAYTTKTYVDGELAAIKLDIQKITEVGELDTESLAEKIIAINQTIGTTADEVVKSLFERIAENKVAVQAVASDLAGYKVQVATEQAAQDQAINNAVITVNALGNTVVANKTAQDAINSDIEGRVASNESSITKLNGDDTVVGSVAKQVKDAIGAEALRAKTVEGDLGTLTTDSKVSLAAAINEVDANADAAKAAADAALLLAQEASSANSTLGQNITDLTSRVVTLEAEKVRVSDILDNKVVNGEVVKGAVTRIADLEAGLIANQADQDAKDLATNAKIDAIAGSGLVTGVICGKKAANKFRLVFGQALIAECDAAPVGGGDNGGL